jgi:phytoene dehydrogenase-like protein
VKYDAVIIGAGHNGLVTAAYLARAGLYVLVLEQRPVVGGAAVTEEQVPGFTFEPCAASVNWFHPGVARDLDLSRHGLKIISGEPTLFAPLPGGDHLLLESGRSVEAIQRFSAADARRWQSFNAHVARLRPILEALYSITPPAGPALNRGDLSSFFGLGASLRQLGRRDVVELLRTLPMSVVEFLDEWFESDVLKGALGAAGITGIFQGPYAAGTAYVLLHHLLGSPAGGLWSPGVVRGGMGNLARALTDAAKRYGVAIRTGVQVARVMVEDNTATGVVLAGGEEVFAHRVISNADPSTTFLNLVDPLELDPTFIRKVRNIKYRGACARVNLALDALPAFATLPGDGPHLRGLILISPSLDYLERAYDDAKYGEVSRIPHLQVSLPSLVDPSRAPRGKHVMTVLFQYAPYHLRGGEWDEAQRTALGDKVEETLSEYMPALTERVVGRQVLTPLDLEQRYGLTEGNLYHGELTLDQLLFMRPVPGWARYKMPVRNLYLCGAGTHPGGGVNGASGRNAAREVLKEWQA